MTGFTCQKFNSFSSQCFPVISCFVVVDVDNTLCLRVQEIRSYKGISLQNTMASGGDKARRKRGPPPPTVCCPQCHSFLFCRDLAHRLASPYLFIQRLIGSRVFIPALRLSIMKIERHNAARVKQSAEAFKLLPIPLTNLMGRL